MCKYSSSCELCHCSMEVSTEHKNMQAVTLKISSDCPNLKSITDAPIQLDPMKEVLVSNQLSDFYKLLDQHPHPEGCSVYKNVKDAIGQSLGRYYELA